VGRGEGARGREGGGGGKRGHGADTSAEAGGSDKRAHGCCVGRIVAWFLGSGSESERGMKTGEGLRG
jgi:hypothetical protein